LARPLTSGRSFVGDGPAAGSAATGAPAALLPRTGASAHRGARRRLARRGRSALDPTGPAVLNSRVGDSWQPEAAMSARGFIALDTLGKLMTSRYVISFGAAWLGVIAVVLLALRVMGGFRGLDAAGDVALVFGIIFTSGLCAALMALVFYSDRSNADEDAYRAADAAGESPSTERRTGDGDSQ
jgi:hypothetical protein